MPPRPKPWWRRASQNGSTRPTPLARIAYFGSRPLKELCLSRPSEVMSRYSTSAVNDGSTQTALGFLIGFVSLDWGLITESSCSLI